MEGFFFGGIVDMYSEGVGDYVWEMEMVVVVVVRRLRLGMDGWIEGGMRWEGFWEVRCKVG